MKTAYSTTHSFDLHGISIRVDSAVPSTDTALTSLLGSFATEPTDAATLHISIESVEDTDALADRLPSNGSILYSNRPHTSSGRNSIGLAFDVYRTTEQRFVDLGSHGLMVFNLGDHRAEIILANSGALHEDIIGSLLLYTVSELARPLGLRLIHAAAVASDGRAVLIPGTQGRGKTTTCLALGLSGYTFLSDDIVFLRDHDGVLEICGLPEHLSLTDKTIGLFPDVASKQTDLTTGLLKRHILPDRLFDGRIGRRATPALILFPEVTGETESFLEPLPRPRALELLLPRGLSVLDQEDAASSFQTLSRLVAQSACYRLRFGTDVSALRPLLDAALGNFGPSST